MERSGGVAAIVCDTRGNTVRQGCCYTCLTIGGVFGRVTKTRPTNRVFGKGVKSDLRNKKSAQRGRFRPDVPADIQPRTSVRPSKSHFGTDVARGRPRKNCGLKNFRLIFPFPRIGGKGWCDCNTCRGDHAWNMFGTSLHTNYCTRNSRNKAIVCWPSRYELLRCMNYGTNYCDSKQLLQWSWSR